MLFRVPRQRWGTVLPIPNLDHVRNYYPGSFLDKGSSMLSYYAVVQSAETKLSMSGLDEIFVGVFFMDNRSEPDVGVVPVESIKHPLGVLEIMEEIAKNTCVSYLKESGSNTLATQLQSNSSALLTLSLKTSLSLLRVDFHPHSEHCARRPSVFGFHSCGTNVC